MNTDSTRSDTAPEPITRTIETILFPTVTEVAGDDTSRRFVLSGLPISLNVRATLKGRTFYAFWQYQNRDFQPIGDEIIARRLFPELQDYQFAR